MGANNLLSQPVELKIKGDRKRVFFLGFRGIHWLAAKHGSVGKAFKALSESNQKDLTEDGLEIMIDFIYAGLLKDCQEKKETLPRETILDLMDNGYSEIMEAITKSMAQSLPESSGDAGAEADPTQA